MFMVIEDSNDRDFIAGLYTGKYRLWISKAYALTNDMHTAEDMVNDAFVKLFGKIGILRSMDCCRATAYVVITIENTCKTYLSKSSKTGNSVDFYAENNMEWLESAFSTEKAVLEKLDIELAAKVIRKLDKREQDFIVKSYFERIGDREIAKQMGMSYNNIRTYRCRLISKIKKLCMKESEEKSSGRT